MHPCTDCGLEHEPAIELPAPVIEAPADDAAAVEIARIEAKRDVEVAKIDLERSQLSDTDRIARLEAELEVLRAAATAPPIVIVDPVDEPATDLPTEPDMVPVDLDAETADAPAPAADAAPEKKEKKKSGWKW